MNKKAVMKKIKAIEFVFGLQEPDYLCLTYAFIDSEGNISGETKVKVACSDLWDMKRVPDKLN